MRVEITDISDNMVAMYDALGEEKFIEVVKLYGGNNVYIPTYKSVIRAGRDREIIRKYNGVNGESLAREYGISVVQLRNIVK
ncbi:MAG: Mor transcription activator family protein [Peptostreptococcaceae bacterium]